MPPAAMTDYTFAYGENGFVLNSDFAGAVPFFDITDISGLDSAPFRTNTDEHEGTDGTYVDAQFMSMRTIVISGNLYTNPGDPESTCDLIRAQYGAQFTAQPLYFQLPGRPLRFVNAKSGGVKYDLDTNRNMGMTAMQITLLAGDPYIYEYPASVASVDLSLPILNQNWDFESGVSPWTAANNATLSQSSVWSFSNFFSALFTGDGVTVNPAILSENTIPVTALTQYIVSAELYSPQGWTTVNVTANWFTAAGASISTSSVTSTNVPAGVLAGTLGTNPVTAPATAAKAQILIMMVGSTPPATVQMFADNVQMNPAGIGMGFNMGFPAGFGGMLTAPEVAASNNGNHTAYPIITLTGPLTLPTIVDTVNGITMQFNITLTSSDTLVIDCRKKSIVLNGAQSRRSALSGIKWFSIPANTSDTFLLSANSGTGAMSVTLNNTFW